MIGFDQILVGQDGSSTRISFQKEHAGNSQRRCGQHDYRSGDRACVACLLLPNRERGQVLPAESDRLVQNDVWAIALHLAYTAVPIRAAQFP